MKNVRYQLSISLKEKDFSAVEKLRAEKTKVIDILRKGIEFYKSNKKGK